MTSVVPIRSNTGGLLASRPATSQQLASQQQARRQRASVRRAREHRLHTAGAISAGIVLAAVLAGGLYFGMMSPAAQSHTAEKIKPGSFEATRTGHVYVPVDGGGFCKSLQFNNQTGEFNNTGLIGCDDVAAVAPPHSNGTGTYTTFTESFKKR
jgi:hypothetical protein